MGRRCLHRAAAGPLAAWLALVGCSESSMTPGDANGALAGEGAGGAGTSGGGGTAAQAGAGGRRNAMEGGAGATATAGRNAGGAGGAGGASGAQSPPIMEPPDLDPNAGNTGFVQPACGAPVAQVTGPLCGPSAAPCRRIAEHTFDLLTADSEVSLAFDGDEVHVLQERGTPTYLVPATDTFRATTQQIPGPTMKGPWPPAATLAIDAMGAAVALLYGNLPGTTELWRRGEGASGWRFDSETQADLLQRNRLYAGAGCLHAALSLDPSVSADRQSHPVYGVYDGRWQEFVLGPRNVLGAGTPALALDAEGAPHLVYWKATASAYSLYYAIPGSTLEAVGATGSATPSGVQHLPGSPLLAVTADADGKAVVHVVRAFTEMNRNASAIVLATRRAGVWTEREVIRWAPRTPDSCPPVEGQSCTYAVEDVQPRALFASANGDLRLFVERHTNTQTVTYSCITLPIDCITPPPCGPNPRQCMFNGAPPAAPKVEILVGWPEGDAFEFVPYGGAIPEAVSPNGHFWARRRGTANEFLTLLEDGS